LPWRPEDLLSRRIAPGDVDVDEVASVADAVARLHARAMTGPRINRVGVTAAVEESCSAVLERLAQARRVEPDVVSDEALAFLRARLASFCDEHRTLLEHRVADWRIRECHGGLAADRVCLGAEGVRIVGCVSPDPAVRCGDVAKDVAALVVDLDDRGASREARAIVERYAAVASDPDVATLLALHRTLRALELAAESLEGALAADERPATTELVRIARNRVHLALGYEMPVSIVLACGGPAGDRRAAARHLSERLGATLLRAAPGVGDGDVRDALVREAVRELHDECSVVVDDEFARASHRRPFLDAAARLGVACYALQVGTPRSFTPVHVDQPGDAISESEDAAFRPSRDVDGVVEPLDEFPRDRVVHRSTAAPPEEHCRAMLEAAVALTDA
ncbi:MAG: hypothetical protein R3F34_20220, partial [Planctomycetota bacterium]